jgi:outer membrane receptor protein involved in Fe transport
MRVRSRAAAWLAACVTTLPAPAQELEELVVTATRDPMPIDQVTASLGVIDATELALIGGLHHADAMNRVAGVYVQPGSGQESLTAIRSPVLTGAGACGAFLALEDGLAIRPIGFCNVNDLFEVNLAQAAAIEILRGPGPALYGASAAHGVVNALTPSVAALPAWSVAAAGGADDFARLALAGRTFDGARGFGAYGHATHDGGYRDSSGYDEAKLNLLYDTPAGAGQLRVRAAGTWLEQETAGFILGYDAYRDAALARSNPNPEAFRDAWSARASAAWSGSRCEGCTDDIRFIVRRSDMQFLQHFLLGTPLEDNGQTSAALAGLIERPIAGFGAWRAGTDLEWADAYLTQFQSNPTTGGSPTANAIRPAGLQYDFAVTAATAGVYGGLTWEPNAHWRANVALRLERTRYDYDNRMIDGNTNDAGVPCVPGPCLYSRPADRIDIFDNTAPKIDIAYAPTSTQRFFAAWSRGFRPPEMTELYRLQRQQSVADLGSEQLDGGELGWRGTYRSATWALAAFALDKDTVILRDSAGFNVNGGATSHRGVEYEFTWRFAPFWLLSAAGTYARHEYEFSAAIEGGERIVEGNDVDTAPRNVHGARLAFSNGPAFEVELEGLYVGAYWLDAANLHRYGGHTLFNLRAAWSPSPPWRLTARVVNLTDVAYADRADFAFGEYRYFPGRPRSLFVEIAYRAE